MSFPVGNITLAVDEGLQTASTALCEVQPPAIPHPSRQCRATFPKGEGLNRMRTERREQAPALRNSYQSVEIGVHLLYRISKITTQANSRVQSRNGSEKYTDAPARSLSA